MSVQTAHVPSPRPPSDMSKEEQIEFCWALHDGQHHSVTAKSPRKKGKGRRRNNRRYRKD